MIRSLFFFVMLVTVAACISPTYRPPAAVPDRVQAARAAALQDAMQTALDRRARVYDLAWPVLAANTDLCPVHRPSIGLVVADQALFAKMAGDLRTEDISALGVPDHLQVVHAMAASPAGKAGLRRGTLVHQVDGEAITSPGAAATRMRDALEKKGEVSLVIGPATARRTVTLAGVPACAMPVKISQSQGINAHAAGGEIVIYTGLIRALDDAGLQFVIAHEAAHIAERHPRKYVRNLAVSAGWVTGPLLYAGAMAVDGALTMLGQDPQPSFKAQSVRAVAPWSARFEAEADYLGLYMFVRAGGDGPAARAVFDTFSREAPSSIYLKVTHPLTPERIGALEATLVEISEKQARGDALVPEKR